MTTETMSTYHHTDEDEKEGYSLMFAVLMFLIYVFIPLAFWALIYLLIF